MTDISIMANKPVAITLGGVELQCIRPSLDVIFAESEKDFIDGEIEKIRKAADECGFQGGEKIRFVNEGIKELPRGLKLQEIVWEQVGSIAGMTRILYHAAQKHQPDIDRKTIEQLVLSDIDLAGEWCFYLCGIEKKAPAQKTVKAKKKKKPSKKS